jgi:acyl-CoA reductase-like NAD-dependent aldehyde dehydrogenase
MTLVDQNLPAACGTLSWRDRRTWLRRFRRAVAAHGRDLARVIAEEVGKPESEAYVSEVLPLVASIRWHEACAGSILGSRPAWGRPGWLLGRTVTLQRAPLGRVLIIATWNYPAGLLGIQLLQAIAAGNQVTVKPSERSPESQRLLVRLAASCGLPDGWIELADASRAEGERLVAHGGFDKVIFTGGSGTGLAVAKVCAESLTPSVLELSGRDSALVLSDADPALAARRLWLAFTMNAGQTCMAPRRALVDRSVYRAFLDAMAPLAAGARPVRLVDAIEAQRCTTLVNEALALGARSLSGVAEAASDGWMRPIVAVDCPAHAPLVHGEHFGPVMAVVPVDGLHEALEIHRRNAHVLATSVFSRSARRLQRNEAFVQSLGSSVVTFNECVTPTGHPGVSIAGRGASGWGASRGEAGLLELTRPLSVSRTASWTPDAEPPPPRMLGMLDRVVRGWHGARSPGRLEHPARPAFEGTTVESPVTAGKEQHG